MKRRLKIHDPIVIVMSCAMILSAAFAPNGQAAAQERLQRPPSQGLDEIPVVPAGAQWVPAGTTLIFEMETPLSSKYSLPSDRFRARLVVPVIDANGKAVIPADSIAEGRVIAVRPAQRPRRSGIISVSFDRLRLRGGRVLPLHGILTSVDPRDRKKFDEEGDIKPSTRARDVAFVGGTTGAGVGIGLIAGGALAGAGIGAAVGATSLLLTKGKEAIVEPGQRFGLELSRKLYLRSSSYSYPGRPLYSDRYLYDSSVPHSGVPDYYHNSEPYSDPYVRGSLRTPPDLVDVSYVRAERAHGDLRILVTAETPSTGWRIYTHHIVAGDTVEVKLRGEPNGGYSRISHPVARPIIIPDRDQSLRRVVVHARNGVREIVVEQKDYPPSPPPIANGREGIPLPPPGYYSNYLPPPRSYSPPAPRLSPTQLSLRLMREVEHLRDDFGASVGVVISRNEKYERIADRRPEKDEKRLLDSMGALHSSLRAYIGSRNPSEQRNSVIRIQEDLRIVEEGWLQIRMEPDFNQRFRNLLRDGRTLVTLSPGRGSSTIPVPRDPEVLPKPKDPHVVGQIQQVEIEFGKVVGVWFPRDDSYEVVGPRQPTSTERQLLSGLIELLDSVKQLNSARGDSARRDAALRVRDAARTVEQYWLRVPLGPELNQKFRLMLEEARALADAGAQ